MEMHQVPFYQNTAYVYFQNTCYLQEPCSLLEPITRWQILDSSKLKDFAHNNFEFDENGRKLSKQVENTVGKREIARSSNFSFSHSVFKRLVSQKRQKVSLCGNGFTHYHTMPHSDALKIYSCGKHCEKRRNCLLQAISPFLTMLSTHIFHSKCILKHHLQFVSIWTNRRFCRLVMG